MKNRVFRITLAVLLIGVVALLSGCGKSEPEQAVVEPVQPQEQASEVVETFDLHGDYAIDITNLGMALKFYLRIAEDNTFVLSANRQFSDNRGSGTIGEMDGTYLMIYSDSTPESSKTATFERIGPNLIFRSTLPYGTAKIHFERVDDENPEIVYHLTADKYVYEEYYDTYLGFAQVDGIDYNYVLELGAGAKYKLVSRYEDGEGSAEFTEVGNFRVSAGNLFITPQGEEALTGSITGDGALEFAVRPTATSDRVPAVFRVATTAEHAGTWYAQDETGSTATLELDYFSGYLFSSDAYTEEGTFEVTQGDITFTREGQEPVSGTKGGYLLQASFASQPWTFYDTAIQGEFAGSTMVNEAFQASLKLRANGSFALEIVDEESETVLVSEAGLFTITAGPMAFMVTLKSDQETVRVGEIWPTGLNMTFDIGGTNYSFLLTK